MPTDSDNGYFQDVIAPVRVQHRVEFGDLTIDAAGRTTTGHFYNYLVYEFRDGTQVAEAWSYQDEASTALVRYLEPRVWTSDFTMRVLVFLKMRFDRIEGIPESNRVPRPFPLPEGIEPEVNRRMDEHIRSTAV